MCTCRIAHRPLCAALCTLHICSENRRFCGKPSRSHSFHSIPCHQAKCQLERTQFITKRSQSRSRAPATAQHHLTTAPQSGSGGGTLHGQTFIRAACTRQKYVRSLLLCCDTHSNRVPTSSRAHTNTQARAWRTKNLSQTLSATTTRTTTAIT